MFNRRLALALALILTLALGGVALAQTNISGSVTTVPANSVVMDYGMVPLDANTTVIPGCDYVWKVDLPVPPNAVDTIDAPAPYVGTITFTITGNEVDGYTIMVADTIDGYTAVIEQAYFGIGNNARKFTFDPAVTYASPLPAPINPALQPGEISHTHFCYNFVEDEPPPCEWIGETAWAAGNRYVTPGNWATYTPYVADSTVILYAGQDMEAGTVEFSAPDTDGNVTITITLNDGWRFAPDEDEDDNVKIQDYEFAPSGNPAPGQFAHKDYASESPFSITVPANNFYGVHVDVEWEDCP